MMTLIALSSQTYNPEVTFRTLLLVEGEEEYLSHEILFDVRGCVENTVFFMIMVDETIGGSKQETKHNLC